MKKLLIHITLESRQKPDRDISLERIRRTISDCIQYRFPEYDVEVGDLIADWPDAEKEFPPSLHKDRVIK